jgi:hypothetical protein
VKGPKLKVLASTFPRFKERGRVLATETEFGRKIRQIKSGSLGSSPIYISADKLAVSEIPSLAGCAEAAAALPFQDWRGVHLAAVA